MGVEPVDKKKGNVLGEATIVLKRKPKKEVLRQSIERKSLSLNWASSLISLSETLILLGVGGAIFWFYTGWVGTANWLYIFAILAPTLVVVLSFHRAGLYNINSICNPLGQIHKVLWILVVTFLSFLALAFALKMSSEFSRVWFFSWFLSSAFLIFVERELWRFILGRWASTGRLSRKIVIVGSGEQAKRFLKQLESKKEPWISLDGVFDDRKERAGTSFMGHPVLGNLDDLMDYVRKNNVDDIIVTLPWSADKRLLEIIRRLEELPVTVSLCSDLAGFLSLRTSYSSMCGVPMLDVVNMPLNGWKYLLKGAEDKFFGFFFLVVFSPLLLLIALAIKLESKGPVFFRQNRHGFNNKEFVIFKFRTMLHGRPLEDGVPQAKRDDPRVTRIGAFLRRTSLDELPQLLNVIDGTMSIVGPRPHAVEHNDQYSKIINSYFARHRVKPGITGWAQVNGFRGETQTPDKMQARFDYDVYYIENWSILLDARILVMTVFVISSRKNAY